MINDKQFSDLKNWFEGHQGTITAFSGGIDSALVLFLSRKFIGREGTIGVISKSESLKSRDYKLAVGFAEKYDIVLETIYTEELSDEKYNTNPSNRCYFCKSHLYNAINKVKEQYAGYTILNGTNKDDFSDYRPGMKAADENEVKSPLAELDMGKDEIRKLAKYFGIPIWDKPSSPCLSSRIPYGDAITAGKLSQIEKAEGILNDFGFNDVRVRHYEAGCKIEVPVAQIENLKKMTNQIIPIIKELGFNECIIDEEGLISGKLNNALNLNNV